MIGDLDLTLKLLLEREIDDLGAAKQNVYFDAPGDRFAPTLPAVDLFLYDVRENHGLRSNEWSVERNNTTAKKLAPPVRVDCSYLITAWAGDVVSEHRLLSKVMKVLLRYPTLPAEALQGSLAGLEPPLPTAALQPGHLQSLGEFWQALGGKPKAALNYTVTIAMQPHEPVVIGPPVTDKQVPGMPEG
jgi:hypothetical protein